MKVERFFVDNGDGTLLAVKRVVRREGAPVGRPALIVPGYGMNSFVFGFHPDGTSLEASLAASGLDVYSVDLRGQGQSRREPPSERRERFGLAELATRDLPRAVDAIAERTGKSVDLIGCSLGTSIAFAYLAHRKDAPVGSVVAVGGLVTWVRVPRLLSIAFASPKLAGALELKGTRALARRALPVLAKAAPGLLSIYVNVKSTDLSRASEMTETVEDPNPTINEEIARWMKSRELHVAGVNVSAALRDMRYPLLCVVARQDGIVPEETARGVYDEIGSVDKELLVVGTAERPIAHADLFLSRGAQTAIFEPIARFLVARG